MKNANVNLSIDSKKISIDSTLNFSIKGLKMSGNKAWKAVAGGDDNRKTDTSVIIDKMDLAIDYKEDLAGIIKVATDIKKKGFSEILADIGKGNSPISDGTNINCSLSMEGVVYKKDDKNKTISWTAKDGKRTSIDETADSFIDMELDYMQISGKLDSVIDAVIGLVASCTREEPKSKEELTAEKEAIMKEKEEERKANDDDLSKDKVVAVCE